MEHTQNPLRPFYQTNPSHPAADDATQHKHTTSQTRQASQLPPHLRQNLTIQSLPMVNRALSDIQEVNTSFRAGNSSDIENENSSSEADLEEWDGSQLHVGDSRIAQDDDYEAVLTPAKDILPVIISSVNSKGRKRSMYESHSQNYKRRTLLSAPSSRLNSDNILGSDDSVVTTATNMIINNNITAHSYISSSYGVNSKRFLSSESVYNFGTESDETAAAAGLLPSSPPRAMDSRYGPLLTSSPQRELELDLEIDDTLNNHAHSDDDENDSGFESGVEFNINRFNKLGAYLSSDPAPQISQSQESHSDRQRKIESHVQRIINEAFDNGSGKIHIESLGLRQIPDTIEDLKNLVTMTPHGVEVPDVEIYSTHNELKVLPPSLFEVTNCTVLSLRSNKIRKIPDKISKLTKLRSLTIVSNEIQVLPYQILKLAKLEHVLVRPNPKLIELKDQEKGSFYQISNHIKDKDQRRFISKIKWVDLPPHLAISMSRTSSTIPTAGTLDPYEQIMTSDRKALSKLPRLPKLGELTLRHISQYTPTHAETQVWKRQIAYNLQLKITKSLQKGVFGERCAICEQVTVNPVAKCLEWWDFRGEELLPVRLNFCCGGCVDEWMRGVESGRERFIHGGDDGEQERADENDDSNHEGNSQGDGESRDDDQLVFDAEF